MSLRLSWSVCVCTFFKGPDISMIYSIQIYDNREKRNLKTIVAVSILTLKVLITHAPVKECSAFRITMLLLQSVLKIVYISICVEIMK